MLSLKAQLLKYQSFLNLVIDNIYKMEKEIEALNNLKTSFEMNGGQLFVSQLKRIQNFHFFASFVNNPENAYFVLNNNGVVWLDEYTCRSDEDSEKNGFFEIIINVSVEGTINEYDKEGLTYLTKPLKLALTIHTFIYKNDFSPGYDNINLLNDEQKSLLLYHKRYELELDRLGIKLLNEYEYFGQDSFSFFTRIWKAVNKDSNVMIRDSSLDFFNELVECHRNIVFSIGNLNMWGRYKTNYKSHKYDFNGTTIYPAEVSYFDNRYTYYMENAIEELYTFYEKLAYLLYIFLSPTSLEQNRLSFGELFHRKVIKELRSKYNKIAESEHLIWFLKRRSEYKKLQKYRHPLVHYKANETFITGTYSASLRRLWLANVGDKDELDKLFQEFDKIQKFINDELLLCKASFEHCILLIESIPTFIKHPINEITS